MYHTCTCMRYFYLEETGPYVISPLLRRLGTNTQEENTGICSVEQGVPRHGTARHLISRLQIRHEHAILDRPMQHYSAESDSHHTIYALTHKESCGNSDI